VEMEKHPDRCHPKVETDAAMWSRKAAQYLLPIPSKLRGSCRLPVGREVKEEVAVVAVNNKRRSRPSRPRLRSVSVEDERDDAKVTSASTATQSVPVRVAESLMNSALASIVQPSHHAPKPTVASVPVALMVKSDPVAPLVVLVKSDPVVPNPMIESRAEVALMKSDPIVAPSDEVALTVANTPKQSPMLVNSVVAAAIKSDPVLNMSTVCREFDGGVVPCEPEPTRPIGQRLVARVTLLSNSKRKDVVALPKAADVHIPPPTVQLGTPSTCFPLHVCSFVLCTYVYSCRQRG
jgi:hypothetical protein